MKFNTLLKSLFYLLFLIATTLNAKVTYTHTDTLGSVIAESDESGKAIKSYHYAPYGESIPSVKNNNPGYTGHVYDNDLGLSYMKARYYDPEIGRFYSNDPVGFSADNTFSFNRYAYANNNPYKFVDPDGRYVETAWDVFNVGLGLASLSYNINEGNWGGAALDTVGLAYDGFATAVPFLPAGLGTAIKAGRGAKAVSNESIQLSKKLASEEQLGELFSKTAERIAGAGTKKKLNDAPRLAKQYGGESKDWAKIRSSNKKHPDGFRQETHAYQNTKTDQIVEPKTKIQGH